MGRQFGGCLGGRGVKASRGYAERAAWSAAVDRACVGYCMRGDLVVGLLGREGRRWAGFARGLNAQRSAHA